MSIAVPMSVFIPAAARRPTVTVPVTLYGTWWNLDGHRMRRALRRAGIPHRYVDVDAQPDAKSTLRSIVSDELEYPVVYIDGDWLMAPTLDEVESSLRKHGLGRIPNGVVGQVT